MQNGRIFIEKGTGRAGPPGGEMKARRVMQTVPPLLVENVDVQMVVGHLNAVLRERAAQVFAQR